MARLLELCTWCSSTGSKVLLDLESQLADVEIAQFRWWAWAQQHAKVCLCQWQVVCPVMNVRAIQANSRS